MRRYWRLIALLAAIGLGLWLVPVKVVVLWTDALIFLLVGVLTVFVIYMRGKPHLRAPWGQVIRRPLAAASLVVLCAYVVVGLLDSVHFRERLALQAGVENGAEQHYSVEVLSLLDLLTTPLRTRLEKTYSAPLAAQLYSKETVTLDDGSTARIYPRLDYGGVHLDDPASQRGADIAQRSLTALLLGLLAWAMLVAAWVVWLARRHGHGFRKEWRLILRGEAGLPWRSIFGTVGALILFIALALKLGIAYHLLGTDKVGNDVLYLSLKSIRTGLVIGTLTTLIMLPFAVLLGIMAGYFRGWVDDVIQYIYTTLSSIPGVLLIAAAILSVQVYIANNPDLFETVVERADLRLLFLCMILGITSWTGLCRLLRGETLKLREQEYIQAATAFGVSNFKIITRHILPNVMHIVLIAVVLDFSALVLAEAVLSYVGVGVDPSMISWGNMINSARLEMAREPVVWWSLIAAFCFMFLLVLAANLFSDAVRDAFDPRTGRG
ncbi:MAG: ABC transporter permease [Gammaproteobacteria bacterium]|nr:ABC transporter permease [Gammaproteobacteria bacterium]